MKQSLAVAVIGVACVLVVWANDFNTSLDAQVAIKEAGVGDGLIAVMVKTGGASASAAQPAAEPKAQPAANSVAGAAPVSTSSAPMPKPILTGPFRETLSGGGEGPEMVVIPAG